MKKYEKLLIDVQWLKNCDVITASIGEDEENYGDLGDWM